MRLTPGMRGIGLATFLADVGHEVPTALLADLAPTSAYGRAYGFERMMDNLGAIGGPLLTLGLVTAIGVRSAIPRSIIPELLATNLAAHGSR